MAKQKLEADEDDLRKGAERPASERANELVEFGVSQGSVPPEWADRLTETVTMLLESEEDDEQTTKRDDSLKLTR
jgi:hypothetical protein